MNSQPHLELYDSLMSLTQVNNAFYHQDFVIDDCTYRIFNYRLASYSDFLLPGALEARGIMFYLSPEGPIIASRPFPKFFNLNENPFTTNLNLHQAIAVETKADGSLISTFLHNEDLRLKSKGSLFSPQAIDAMNWLSQPENVEFKKLLKVITSYHYTVNLEWVSPTNRIVLGYDEPQLLVLNVRNNTSGEYSTSLLSRLSQYAVSSVDIGNLDIVDFVGKIPLMEGIEGYVVTLISGQKVKIKTDWYKRLHAAKSDILNPKVLFELVLFEQIDDTRSMFFADTMVMSMIDEMQHKVSQIFNDMVKAVESFYIENRLLDRKSYALLAKDMVDGLHFPLVMQKYAGSEIDYKQYLLTQMKRGNVLSC